MTRLSMLGLVFSCFSLFLAEHGSVGDKRDVDITDTTPTPEEAEPTIPEESEPFKQEDLEPEEQEEPEHEVSSHQSATPSPPLPATVIPPHA
nr:hypothetical protein [Tanacetum cinerariifolium]